MTISKQQAVRLQQLAQSQPAAEAILFFFFVWLFVGCTLLWVFSGRAFPLFDGAQGASLPWIGILLSVGGLIAAALCFLLYLLFVGRKRAAIEELNRLDTSRGTPLAAPSQPSGNGENEGVRFRAAMGSAFIFIVSMLALGFIVYLLQSFCC